MDASLDPGPLASRLGQDRPARVLVVEDDDLSQAEVLGLLARYDLEVVVAVDGGAALDRVDLDGRDAGPFDLVLLDLGMPMADGIVTARLLRLAEGFEPDVRRFVRMPIVAMAADDRPATLAACERAGFDDVLTKPITREDLDAVCERWLGCLPAERADAHPGAPAAGRQQPPGGPDGEVGGRGGRRGSSAAVLWREVDRQEDRIADALDHLRDDGRAAEIGEAGQALAALAGQLGAAEIEALSMEMAQAAVRAPGDLATLGVRGAALLLALARLRPASAMLADPTAA
jgi:CheY-like chemotaxis protein